MTDAQLKAARERVQRLLHGEPFDAIYDADDFETMRYHLPYSEDLFRLADAYVALFDETPIDSVDLHSVPLPQHWKMSLSIRVASTLVQLIAEAPEVNGDAESARTIVQLPITTRGQLKLLLLAMGIQS